MMQCDNHLISSRIGNRADEPIASSPADAFPESGKPVPCPAMFGQSISLSTWCANLVTLVFRSRTPFAAFARVSIRLPRDSNVSKSPAFPIPLPCCGVFGRMPSGLSSSKRSKLHFRRALVLIILALNFWWSGGKFIDSDLLRRTPSCQQQSIIRRVVCLLQVDGPRVPFPLVSVGRRIPKLVARLCELSEMLTSAGPKANPYDKGFDGREVVVPMQNQVVDELEPYRALDSSRLKIVGTGHWDPSVFLSDGLIMAYRNPDCLLFDREPPIDKPKITDPMPEILALAKLWDRFGLLCLHEYNIPELYPDEQIKVFNCYKDRLCDRQIGDRRGRNHYERRLEGPSKHLPSGVDIMEFDFDPSSEWISMSVTDRKDYYHQFSVPCGRAVSNTLGPGLCTDDVKETLAFNAYLARKASKGDRLVSGDQLQYQSRFPAPGKKVPSVLLASFNSILQGDHGGVEFACDAHCGLLQSSGLLCDSSRVIANRPYQGRQVLEGLVIDDYFALSSFSLKNKPHATEDAKRFDIAQECYESHKLLGSAAKDIRSSSTGKLIGAFVNGSDRARQLGVCPLGSPPEKRLALSWISLQTACLSHTTDALHLCLIGGWVACLGFRRPMMSLLNESFRLVDASKTDPMKPCLVSLSRAVANELLLVALLSPLAIFDLASQYLPEIFSTDASLSKGAICQAPINVDFARVIWRTSRSKGAYHRLLTPFESLANHLGVREELPVEGDNQIERPLAFSYDLAEVFSGAAVVSVAAGQLGLVICPPIDLSLSPEYDVEKAFVLSWLSFMISQGRLGSVIVEPPCTTFSIMRRPALRSKVVPFGHNPSHRQTSNGNLLAQRALQLLYLCLTFDIAGLLETPFSSLLKHLPSFAALLKHSRVSFCRTDSCMLGSIHLKPFRFLAVNACLRRLRVRCDGSHSHVQICGGFTKNSATYTPELGRRLAATLAEQVFRRRAFVDGLDEVPIKGLESQLVNGVALQADWKVVDVWDFKRQSHINILEFSVIERLAKRLVSLGQHGRVCCLVDSHVVSAASAKGRTSSLGLAPVLRRFCALCVAGGLFWHSPYVPTRLNVADDPTRLCPLRSSSGCLNVFDWSEDDLYRLSALPRLRRWTSNWVRIVICLLGPSALRVSDRSLFRLTSPLCAVGFVPGDPDVRLDFDSSLGFPGEGPFGFRFGLLLAVLAHGALCCTVVSLGLPLVSFAMVLPGLVQGMQPRNAADLSRQLRRNEIPLAVGRPVLASTNFNRDALYAVFLEWCRNQQVDFEGLLENALAHAEEINTWLAHYGRQLYHCGRPYGHYSETINAVVSQKAILRRCLQPAWDVAYSWMRNEPPSHHTAMPWQVLLALLSTAITWGWLREAGLLALSFGGLLRAGECLNAVRRDLLLPSDTCFSNSFILLALDEAKTRFSAARHQCAKLDAPDLAKLVILAFGHLLPNEKLWPQSNQTFRNRFRLLQSAVGLPTTITRNCRPLDLGSLRPGGATWLLQVTENAELVRRRGRWTTTKVLEVYLQETACVRFLNGLEQNAKEKVYFMAALFPTLLAKADSLVNALIPPSAWYKLFRWS